MSSDNKTPAEVAAALGVPGVERHVLLCVDEDGDAVAPLEPRG